VMIGWWQGFPFWTTAFVCATGGVLGVMFSVPLRRALVTGSTLPYPEGTAAAEVLVVGCADESGSTDNKRGLRILLVNALASAGYALLIAMKLATAEVARFFKVGTSISGVAGSLSFALMGVGHLVGLSVGLAMIIGVAISWVGLMPYFTAGMEGEVDAIANTVFRNDVRFVGAGTIGVAAVWTLLKVLGPIINGIRSSLASSAQRARGETLALTERDLPFPIVAMSIVAMLAPIALLLYMFIVGGSLADSAVLLITVSLLYILVAGLAIASVCGYMAGLIGASNSPISGVGILAVLGISLLMVLVLGRGTDAAETLAVSCAEGDY
ncbi:MAG: oligopeptide transporter, OPT family, partial [Pseudomonadota bacterium]